MKHFKQKEKRKHSIKRQMIAVFAGMVICLIAILLVVNVKFLEPYYIRDKESSSFMYMKNYRML